jgi:hypothetical protein
MWGALTDERTSLFFIVVAGPRQRSILRSESRETHDHILLSQSRCSKLEGQVSVFISLRNRVARLYSQELGSLFITSFRLAGLRWGHSNPPTRRNERRSNSQSYFTTGVLPPSSLRITIRDFFLRAEFLLNIT